MAVVKRRGAATPFARAAGRQAAAGSGGRRGRAGAGARARPSAAAAPTLTRGGRATGRARPDRRAAAGDGDDAAAERLLGAARGRPPGVAAAARRERPAGAAGGRPSVSGDGRRAGGARHRAAPERHRLGHRGAGLRAGAPRAARVRRRAGGAAGAAAAADRDLRRRAAAARWSRSGWSCGAAAPSALQVSPRDETIGCQWLALGGLVGGAAGDAGAVRAGGPARAPAGGAAGRRLSLRSALLVGAEALPAGTPARMLAIGDPARPLLEDNAIAVTVGQPGARAIRSESRCWVECAVPAHLVDAGPSYLRALRGRLVHTLERLWPELGRHISVAPRRTTGSAPSGSRGRRRRRTADRPDRRPRRRAVPPPLYARSAAERPVRRQRPAARHRDQEPAAGRAREPPWARPRGGAGLAAGAPRASIGHAPVRRVLLRRRTLLG